ncbi:hypothetical protein PAN31108_04635 [Pandoraea anhela]|uniref:Uncharacterized protein n=1 Tax=Pandoraea anhela TaxID=2508295 RepID=A0A5E4YN13_9BURK|nr:hypothetical protein PAN31108_04635 [Pandoraea anhela]
MQSIDGKTLVIQYSAISRPALRAQYGERWGA